VLKITLCAVLVVSIAGLTPTLQSTAEAQDDPFATGTPADSNADENPITLADITKITDETTKLVLRTVRDSKPQTPEKLTEAARVLMDVKLYDDARYYLGIVSMMGLDDNQMFELQEAIGSDFFSLIQLTDEVQPEGKTLARKVFTSANKIGLAPARIDQLIKTLNSPDIFVRSEAFRKLRRLGEPAVAELLNVFAQDDRVSEFPGVRGALKSMGAHAEGPLLGAARASDLQVQTEAIRSLGYYRTSEALDVMMRAYLSPKVPQSLRRIALDSLIRAEYPADPTVIEKRLYERSREYLLGKRKADGSLIGAVTIWNWDAATKRLVASKVDPETATRITAARRAADLYEIQPDLPRNREMYLLTQLEAAKRLVGPSRRLDAEALIKWLDTNAEEIEAVLVQALKLELVPAAVACCELLEKIGTEELLLKSNGQPRPLVQSILFGDRHLQFAAMQAIAAIDPQQPYAGSSYMVNLAIYLAQSENRPAGLIGHNRENVGQTYAATLALSGLSGRSVQSSREFFQAATSDPDIEILLVTDTLTKPDYADLIQQLRKDWRTRRLPIAFLYRDVNRSRRIRARIGKDPLFSAIPFSFAPEFVQSHVERLQEKIKPWKLTNFDRRRHGAAAVDWLTKIAGDRDRYGFYDLSNQQSKLTRLLYLPGFVEGASQILASLGTSAAQRELVNFASQSGLPVEERERAVEAFVRSVKNNGTLLTTSEIRQQYDRYNASENEPEATQKVLGTILDAIEARKRASSSD
jgi:HEAT repeat protein